jgi:hypothetical protein
MQTKVTTNVAIIEFIDDLEGRAADRVIAFHRRAQPCQAHLTPPDRGVRRLASRD